METRVQDIRALATRAAAAIRRYVRRRWRRLLLAVSHLALLLIALPLLARFVAYPAAAPDGWHNITPHGTTVIHAFAANAEHPGLILACDTYTPFLFDPRNWSHYSDPHLQVWRTWNGGADWETVDAPFLAGNAFCDLTGITDGGETFYASGSPLCNGSAIVPLWVTHDAGATWHIVARGTTNSCPEPGPLPRVELLHEQLVGSIARNGRLYTFVHVGPYSANQFSVSADEGATWTNPETMPSALERQGYSEDSFAPDYRSPHAWLRTLSAQDAPPMLERSTDDGSTWSAVGRVGSLGGGVARIAANPSRPGQICAYSESKSLAFLTTSDGGKGWRSATTPPDFVPDGFPDDALRMGNEGDCYLAFTYEVPASNAYGRDWHTAIWRLASDHARVQRIGFSDHSEIRSSSTRTAFTYIPSGNGMTSRLIAFIDSHGLTWQGYLGAFGGETTDSILGWTEAR